MAQQLADRVKETTTTTGTGALTLAGAMTGFRAFSSVCSVADTCYYALQAVDSNGNSTGAWEVGLGTYSSASTLTRTTILASSTGSVISLAAGTTQVWMDFPASRLPLSGMADFTDTLSATGTNATIPVVALSPNNATANVDMSIVPTGTGAIQLAIPDGTATGGNKRGANAVDLQTSRSLSAQVASGTYAFAAGGYNTSSALGSTALGRVNTPSGNYAFAAGYSNTVSQSYGAALGSSHTVTGIGAFAAGEINTASQEGSVALGVYAVSAVKGQVAFGQYSQALGQYQRTFTQLRASTTSTTATVATADAASAATTNQLVLRNKSAYRVRMTAVAFDATNFTDAKEWAADVLIVRGATAASAAIVGSPTVTTTYATAGASGWILALSADTTNGALKVTVTSSTTDTVDWNIQLDAIEVM